VIATHLGARSCVSLGLAEARQERPHAFRQRLLDDIGPMQSQQPADLPGVEDLSGRRATACDVLLLILHGLAALGDGADRIPAGPSDPSRDPLSSQRETQRPVPQNATGMVSQSLTVTQTLGDTDRVEAFRQMVRH
jgi:hypothetical protein